MSADGGGRNLRKRKNQEQREEDFPSIYPDLSKEGDDEDIVGEGGNTSEVDGAEVTKVKRRPNEHNFDDQWEPEDPMTREPPIQFAILLLFAAIVLAVIGVVINHGRTAGWFD